MSNILARIQHIFASFRQKLSLVWQRLLSIISRFPLISFFIFIGIIVALVVLGNFLRKPNTDETVVAPTPKATQIFAIGQQPEITVQAKVEKSGIIKITALSGGVIQKINVSEGTRVKRGTNLFSLSSNYQGGNILSLTRQMSQKSYQAAVDNYDLQKDSIAKSRELAAKAEAQGSELREIARKSIDETKTSITLNEEILASLERQLASEIALGKTDVELSQLRSARLQAQSSLNGLRTSLRNTEYLNAEDQEAAQISRLSKENTLNQLELQQRALDLGKEIAHLNLRIAQVSESLMYPASPCPGVVERVHVKIGQSVAPGTLLATIRANDNSAEAIALVSGEVARSLSRFDASTIQVADQSYEVTPRYIATEPTDGVLHAVTYSLPDSVAAIASNGSFVEMKIPISSGLNTESDVYIPLDAVYQSQDGAYLFVISDENNQTVARSRKVTLGSVFGRYVEVKAGLQESEKIILNRNVLEGDVVSIL